MLDNGRTDKSDKIIWDFDWDDVGGAKFYHLFVIGPNAIGPLIDNDQLTQSEYHYEDSSFVVNTAGWTWRVRAFVNGVWTDWSETRVFNLEPPNTDPPNTGNNPPTISAIAAQTIAADSSTATLVFTVGDAETLPSQLNVTASSSNLNLVPQSGILLGGTGANRTILIKPNSGQRGTTVITVKVIDAAGAVGQTSFLLTVGSARGRPLVTGFEPSPTGIRIEITDGDVPVNPTSIRLQIDGALVSPSIAKTGRVTALQYPSPGVLAEGSVHAVNLTLADLANPPVSSSYDLSFTLSVMRPSNLSRPDFWRPKDGRIFAVLETNGIVYVGGQFTYVGPYTGGGAAVSLISGEADLSYPIVAGGVSAVVPDGRGGWYIGGSFASVGDLARNNLVHVLPDKAVDIASKLDANLGVNAMAVVGNTLFVGGYFSNIAGANRNQLAAFDIPSGQLLSWSPSIPNLGKGKVKAMAASANTVYVLASAAGDKLSAIDATTGIGPTWSIPSGEYFALTVACGKVYLGGPNGLLALDPSTGIFRTPAFLRTAGPPSAEVTALASNGDTVYMGGAFAKVGEQDRRQAAAFDAHTESLISWHPALDAGSLIFAIATSGNRVYLAGSFQTVSGLPRKGLAAVDIAAGAPLPWNPKINHPLAKGKVSAFAVSADTAYFGGVVGIGGQPRNNLVALNARTGQVVADWDPSPNGIVYDLKTDGKTIYVAGGFTKIDGQSRTNLARVDLASGKATAWRSDCYDPTFILEPQFNAAGLVNNIILVRDAMIVAGLFRFVAGERHQYLAALDAATGKPKPWNLDLTGITIGVPYSFALDARDTTVFVGGRFDSIGGNFRKNLAAVDVTTGLITPWAPVMGGEFPSVSALAVAPNAVFVGGLFNSIGGLSRTNLAALDATTGQTTDWDPQISGPGFSLVNSLLLGGHTVYVGGFFSQVGGQPRQNLAGLNAVTSKATDWNPQGNSDRLLSISQSAIYSASLGVYSRDGSPLFTRQPRRQTLAVGNAIRLEATAQGQEPLFYQWQKDGIKLAGATNASFAIPNCQTTDSGIYAVVATNAVGLIQSSDAPVVVFTPPNIIVQPRSLNVPSGTEVTVAIVASGNPAPAYQWRLNGIDLPGAVGPTLTLANAQPASGGTYSVVVANIGDAVGTEAAELAVTSPRLAFGDNLRDRGVLVTLSGVGSGNNVTATRETGEPFHAGKISSKSVWLGWRPSINGIATMSTRGSAFDTLLAIYTNAAPTTPLDLASLRLVVADDDRGGFSTSEAVFSVAAGQEYLIAIDGFGKSSGNIVLSWNLDSSISEAPRIFQEPVGQTVGRGGTATFSVVAFSTRPLTYQWFQNCLPIPASNSATLTVAKVQAAQVGQYTVRVSNGLQELESAPAFLQINFNGEEVSSRDKIADVGIPERNIRPLSRVPDNRAQLSQPRRVPDRDSRLNSPGFGGAIARGLSGTQVFHTFGNAKELGEPSHAGEPGGASAWYSVQAEDNGVMTVSTEGSDFDTVLAVYEGPSNPLGFDELVTPAIASDNDSGSDGRTSRVVFAALRTRVYHIAVDGVNGAQGRVNLSYKLEAALPAQGLAPAITVQPQSQTVAAGANVTFNVVATGTAPLSYQWQLNGVNIADATGPNLTLNNVQRPQAGSYRVIVSNIAGSVASAAATLTLSSASTSGPPVIIIQPQSQTVKSGGSVVFTALASGSAPLQYQWLKDGVRIVGATGPTLTLANVQPIVAGEYRVIVTNDEGAATSVGASLTVLTPPTITKQPQSQLVIPGADVTLRVAATGDAPLNYQWKFNGNDLPGATSSALALTNVQSMNAGRYSVVVTNLAGSASSAEAILTVQRLEPLRLASWIFQPERGFRFQLSGSFLSNCVVEVSTNLIDWLPVFTNLNSSAEIEFIDPKASLYPWRFYRAVR